MAADLDRPAGDAPAASPRPKRALLAWEFGGGRTHVTHLLGVGAHLRASGVECLATLYDPRFAAEFEALGIPTVQNYVWPALRRPNVPWKERDVQALGDRLANQGFASPDAMSAAMAHYDGLFSLFDPDIVLAELAFGAILAARGRRPVIAFGTNGWLPPIDGAGFALRDGRAGPPSWPIGEVCAGVNQGLARAGREPLTSLSDLLRIDGVYPFGPPAFDVYRSKRSTPILPPQLPIRPPFEIGRGDEIFIYLQGFVQENDKVMTAIKSLDRKTRLYMPGITEANRTELSACGIHLEDEAVPLAAILRRSRCVLHHGGPQLTTACLAAGIPQIILAVVFDNDISARFVIRNGLGTARRANHASAEWIISATRHAFDDPGMKGRCVSRAPEFAEWIKEDPSEVVTRAALDLIGAP